MIKLDNPIDVTIRTTAVVPARAARVLSVEFVDDNVARVTYGLYSLDSDPPVQLDARLAEIKVAESVRGLLFDLESSLLPKLQADGKLGGGTVELSAVKAKP